MSEGDLQPAYVLHRRRYRESSLIVELFTARHGRVGVMAKGILAKKDQIIQAFQPLHVQYVGRGELPFLRHIEPAEPLPVLTGRRLYCGLYLNELLMRLTARDDPQWDLFSAYATAISQMVCADDTEQERVLRCFELHLLEALGVGLMLREDQAGDPIDPAGYYRFESEGGAVRTSGPKGETTLTGATLLALADDALIDPVTRREARLLMRRLLANHLGSTPLKSRELFR